MAYRARSTPAASCCQRWGTADLAVSHNLQQNQRKTSALYTTAQSQYRVLTDLEVGHHDGELHVAVLGLIDSQKKLLNRPRNDSKLTVSLIWPTIITSTPVQKRKVCTDIRAFHGMRLSGGRLAVYINNISTSNESPIQSSKRHVKSSYMQE
jgi:hypothetical protein